MSFDLFALPFVRWANITIMSSQHKTLRRRLYDHELVYVLDGRGSISIENRKYPACADQLYLIAPGVWHSFQADEDLTTTMPLLGVHFDWNSQDAEMIFPISCHPFEPVQSSLLRPFSPIDGWDIAQKPFLDLRGRPRVRHTLEELVAEHNRGDDEARHNCGALLALSIGFIAREARQLQQLERNSHLGADAVRRVERARQLLESDAVCDIESVATQVGWSGDHLRRMMREVLQQSPYQLQTAARLRRARQMLRDESLPIAHVASRCGFEDASHFSRVFKKDCGLTPRQFLTMSKKI